MLNNVSNKIKQRKTANDKIYTPDIVALQMIKMCNITANMSVLDPSKGGGVFYDNLPECQKDYCEIDENKDFFNYNKKVDLIIGNPPYSLWDRWIEHTITLTDKFCYIFGFLNLTNTRIQKLKKHGYNITQLHLFEVEWWFGRSFIVMFEKNKESIISTFDKTICCNICNTRCKRGKYGNSPNECSKQI